MCGGGLRACRGCGRRRCLLSQPRPARTTNHHASQADQQGGPGGPLVHQRRLRAPPQRERKGAAAAAGLCRRARPAPALVSGALPCSAPAVSLRLTSLPSLPLPHTPLPSLQALGRFLQYAVKKPEVRFITYSDFIRWMQVRHRCRCVEVLHCVWGFCVCACLCMACAGAGGRVGRAGLAEEPRRAREQEQARCGDPAAAHPPPPPPQPPPAPQDPVPLDKFDEWIDCHTPGVKADLSGAWVGAGRGRAGRCGCLPASWAARVWHWPQRCRHNAHRLLCPLAPQSHTLLRAAAAETDPGTMPPTHPSMPPLQPSN